WFISALRPFAAPIPPSTAARTAGTPYRCPTPREHVHDAASFCSDLQLATASQTLPPPSGNGCRPPRLVQASEASPRPSPFRASPDPVRRPAVPFQWLPRRLPSRTSAAKSPALRF